MGTAVDPPAKDQQFQELMEFVVTCEARYSRLPIWSWMSSSGRAVGRHTCRLPDELGYQVFECPCGLRWRRELGGGWLPVDETKTS